MPGFGRIGATAEKFRELKRTNRYYIFELDTATARDNVALGVKEYLKNQGVKYATYITVLAIGGGFTYRMNNKDASLCTASVGEEWLDFEIEEIYITNSAAAGTAKIHVEFRVD